MKINKINLNGNVIEVVVEDYGILLFELEDISSKNDLKTKIQDQIGVIKAEKEANKELYDKLKELEGVEL